MVPCMRTSAYAADDRCCGRFVAVERGPEARIGNRLRSQPLVELVLDLHRRIHGRKLCSSKRVDLKFTVQRQAGSTLESD